ncbi:TrkH family potassium uptake protein [Sulfurisoma sediminicola]|uniref:Trk system potassium uptake protein n=1 Tax=Sulfurisoma sediminicola TaxID=1381557 RepID=A0A497XJZ3_9PROT|nr:potassium transporter TrkG [Sulfurisoma sediminicola]RLJ68241.1 trk system potassium uptake protein TrkH [Sulfurisoma sediminicola]
MLQRVLPVLHVLGLMLMFFSGTYLMPIAASLIYADGTWMQFIDAMMVALGSGALLALVTRRYKRELKPRSGFLLVTLAWILMAAIATVPLMLAIEGLSFTDAFFETMSGLTTTGATVLTGLEKLPPAVNLWRHELNWLGGMGIIVLAVAILPLLGVGGMQLYKAEATGVNKESKLTARIGDTAKALWLVYFGITVACILALKAVGMNWLDAICHAFAALSLGGFSTYDASVGQFDSPAIEAVLIFFMMIAAINFASHFLVWRQRSLAVYLRDAEAKAIVVVIASSTLICSIYLAVKGTYPDFPTSLRHVAFNLVSIATDCGFVSQDYDKWPAFVPLWMLLLSCITASSGSTGGGIKMIRTLILARQGLVELKRLIHPHLVAPLRVGDTAVSPQIAGAVLGFIFLYILTVGELTFFLVASGLDFTSSITAIVACINNAGPGLNVVGPAQNYQALTDFQVWVCSAAMLIGRLEVMTVFVLLTPAFWRK